MNLEFGADRESELFHEVIKTKLKDYTVGPVFFFYDNELNETEMILKNREIAEMISIFSVKLQIYLVNAV
jgi:hypothetical protein